MSLNFNVSPYYDDFDPTKNFHRILFKPGFAVQARELTQSQTILQNQISDFASSIFSQNTPISGGKVTTNLYCYYIRLNTQYNNVSVVAGGFLNKIIKDSTGTVLAKVIATAEATGSGAVAGDPPTLIVTYLSGPQFTDGMTILPTDGTNIGATVSTSTTLQASTGYSSVASISDGVFYVVNGYSQSGTQNADGSYTNYSIGNFVNVSPQTIILNKYNNSPSYRVGLQITETIYDYISDVSLLDPALGASNYQAPGADRYVIQLTLSTLPLTLGNDGQFIELLRINSGSIVKQVDGTVYSTIDDYFAKRDFETNGDYIVEDFKLTPSTNAYGNSTKYDLSVGPGIAYVHGYRVENQSKITLTSDRSRANNQIYKNLVYMDYGNYFVVDTVGGQGTTSTGFDPTLITPIDLHCVTSANIVTANSSTYNSTKVGSGFIRGLQFVSAGTNSNTKSYVYNAYVSDISANSLSNTVSSGTTTTLVINDTNNVYSTVANAYYGLTLTVTTSGTTDTRKIISYTTSGITKTFTVDNIFTITPTSNSTFVLSFNTGAVQSIVKQPTTGYTFTANANIALSGKTNGISTGTTILNNTQGPELIYPVGYPYVASVTNSSYYSTRIFRNQTFSGSGLTLTISSGPNKFIGNGTLSTNAVQQNFTVIDTSTGNILDIVDSVTTTITNGTTVNFATTAYAGKTVNIISNVFVSSGDNISDSGQVLKIKNLVTGDTGNVATSFTSVSGTNVSLYAPSTPGTGSGQAYITNAGISSSRLSLYVSDVKKIKKIVDTKNKSLSPSSISGILSTSSYDITNNFKFDNGQKDNFYDHAGITLLPGAPLPTGNILVIFDYYSHSGGDGYFSVMSYLSPKSSYPESYAQIPVFISTHGTTYNLRDCIDFRPTRQNGQTSYVWDYNLTDNTQGTLIPTNLSSYISDYSYYLARKDKLVLTKDNTFQIIQGSPSVSPILPTEPDGSLVIANLSLDPYTAYVPGEGNIGLTTNLSVNKVLHKRWVKSDITDLENRVNNLEYYTSLSLLESTAASSQIPDVNNITRPNYGILVDDFSSFATVDTQNPDYMANINIRKKQLSPLATVNNFQLQNPVALNSLGTSTGTNTYQISSINGTQTNIFTLPFTKTDTIIQPLASSTISVNPFSVTVLEGYQQLNPPVDNWVDSQIAAPVLVTDPTMQIYQQTNGVTVGNSTDWQAIPGTVLNNNAAALNSPAPTLTSTTTGTQNYQSQSTTITTTSGQSSVPASYSTNNGFLTNSAVLPYIRPQQIIVKSKGLAFNTPVKTWFDGTNVDRYMISPNTIELQSVSGTFAEDDVVGYYVSNTGTFYPVGRVVSTYVYGTGSVRLYIAKNLKLPNNLTLPGTITLQNGNFDQNGNYVYGTVTASGTVSSSAIISIKTSGTIKGVGGTYITTQGTSYSGNLISVQTNSAYCSFLNQYGVWGDANYSQAFNASFQLNITNSDYYTFTASSDGTTAISLDGSQVLSASSYTTTTSYTTSTALTTGYHTISWAGITTGGTGSGGFALTIRDSGGNLVFTTVNPPSLSYTNAGSEIQMPGGGSYFTGVTAIQLGADASSVSNYYAGSVINITSRYVYQQTIASTYVPPPPPPAIVPPPTIVYNVTNQYITQIIPPVPAIVAAQPPAQPTSPVIPAAPPSDSGGSYDSGSVGGGDSGD